MKLPSFSTGRNLRPGTAGALQGGVIPLPPQ